MVREDIGTPSRTRPYSQPSNRAVVSLKDIAGITKLETNDFIKLPIPFKLLRAIDELDFISPTVTQLSLLPLIQDPKNGSKFAVRAKVGSGKSTSIALLTLMTLLRSKASHSKSKSFHLVIVSDKQKRLDMIRLLTQLSTFCPDLLIEPKDFDTNKAAILVKNIPDAIYLIRNKIVKPSLIELVAVDDVDQVFKLAPPIHLNNMFKYIIERQSNKNIKFIFIDNYFSNHTINCFREWKTDIKTVNLTPTALIKNNISHLVKFVNLRNRKAFYPEVINLVENDATAQTVVYCNDDKEMDSLFDYLTVKGQSCIVLKPSMSKELIRKKIKSFKMGRGNLLLSYNLLNSGIKCNNVKFIINIGEIDIHEYYYNTATTGDKDKARFVINLIGKESNSIKWVENVEKEYNIEMQELK